MPALELDQPRKLSLYDVARAVEEDRVAINFQPVVRTRETRFAMFHEGLIRIFDQEGHLRTAGDFMDVIDGSEIGNFVDQVALEMVITRLKFDPAIRLSVNMSPRTMWDEDWMYILDCAGRANRHVTERLIVEFTESSAMGAKEQTLDFMKYCRKYGVCFACDDFGAGQTVLGHLRDFQFDFLKIDGSICQDVGMNRDSEILLKSIVAIAKHFDMTTVAEYIDNEAAAKKCMELGIDGMQGFLYGKGEIYNLAYPNLVARTMSG